ncbi:MAG: hypothetical protein MJ174_10585 [Treponema sp.]|nr:hypothetical protein [Treponema sp.]
MDSFTVSPNTIDDNLIIQGIKDFLFLIEKTFNGENEKAFKLSYGNHICRYKEFKNQSHYTRDIKDLMKNGNITPFKIEVSRIQLTAAIHTIVEQIAGREFSCEFNEYTINDIRALQDALGKLWSAGNKNGSNQKVIYFS